MMVTFTEVLPDCIRIMAYSETRHPISKQSSNLFVYDYVDFSKYAKHVNVILGLLVMSRCQTDKSETKETSLMNDRVLF